MARVRIDISARAETQRPRPLPFGLLQPPRGTGDPGQGSPLPPAFASIRLLIVTRPSCQPRSGNRTGRHTVLMGPLLPAVSFF